MAIPYFQWGVLEFQSNGKKEETRCGMVDKIQGYREICYLAAINDGSSWFRGKPMNPELN